MTAGFLPGDRVVLVVNGDRSIGTVRALRDGDRVDVEFGTGWLIVPASRLALVDETTSTEGKESA